MLRRPFAAWIFPDFSLEKWRLPKRGVAQISWIIEVPCSECQLKCQMVRVGGSHHLNILRGRGTKCQMRARAIHPQILLLRSLRIPIQTLMHGYQTTFSTRNIFTFLLYVCFKITDFYHCQIPWKRISFSQSFCRANAFSCIFFYIWDDTVEDVFDDGWLRAVCYCPTCFPILLPNDLASQGAHKVRQMGGETPKH